MPVAFNAVTVAQGQGSQITLAHNPAGANRLLMFAVCVIDLGASQVIADTPAFGGVLMDPVGSEQFVEGASFSVWKKLAPATGSANIVATFGQMTVNYVAVAVSYTGVHQSVPLGTPVIAAGTGVQVAATVPNTVDGSMVFDAVGCDLLATTATIVAHGGQSERQNASVGNVSVRPRLASSDDDAGGSVQMAWTLSLTPIPWAQIAVEILAAPVGVVAGRSGLAGLGMLGRMHGKK